jgi:GDP-L-fucose synthase
MEHYDGDGHVNVGTGQDLTIKELAELVRATVYPGVEILFDASKPDGMPRKLLDVGRLRSLGWTPEISLSDGIRSTYDWFLAHETSGLRGVPQLSGT